MAGPEKYLSPTLVWRKAEHFGCIQVPLHWFVSNFGILCPVFCDWKTYIILCKHREVEEGSQIGESLDLSAAARAQRFGTPQRERSNLWPETRETHMSWCITPTAAQRGRNAGHQIAVCWKTYSPNCKQGESFQTWFHKVLQTPEKMKKKQSRLCHQDYILTHAHI